MARPRIYPPGEAPVNREHLRASRRRLGERGGRLVQVRLEAEENQALEALKRAWGLAEDREAIARAILQAAERLQG